MEAKEFVGALKDRGIFLVSGVPDSSFPALFTVAIEDSEIDYVPAIREDVALGIASAGYFTGTRGAVFMQNSGIGNVVNPVTSFSLMYGIPVLMVVGWRGYGGPPNDAPEHWIMGEKTAEIMEFFDLPHRILEEGNLNEVLDGLISEMDERSVPGAVLARKGLIQ